MAGDRKESRGINILALVHSQRLTFGLRTNDYARYRTHASRRINTLHRALCKAGIASKGKAIEFSAERASKDVRLLELLVWEAERAWAEGLRAREELAFMERSKQVPALAQKRHRAARRLARASQYARALDKILRDLDTTMPVSTLLQGLIYSAYMQGYHAFVLASSGSVSETSPADGLFQLSQAYVLLEAYARHAAKATDEALAYELLDELEPMLRFCAYKAQISPKGSIAELAVGQASQSSEGDSRQGKLLARYKQEEEECSARRTDKKKLAQPDAIRNLQWRDVDVPIRSAELSAALGKVQTALESLTKARKGDNAQPGAGHRSRFNGSDQAMGSFDRALASLSEAEERTRKMVDDNAIALSKSQSARFESATQPLALAHSYISFQLLTLRIRRDEALFQATLTKLQAREADKPPRSSAHAKSNSKNTLNTLSITAKRRRARIFPVLVKLLESMLQGLEQLRELEVVEEDGEDLAGVVERRIAFDKARRCVYLGQTYALLENYPASLSLYQRGTLYFRQVHTTSLAPAVSANGGDAHSTALLGVRILELSDSDTIALSDMLAKLEDRAKKDWFLSSNAQAEDRGDSLEATIDTLVVDSANTSTIRRGVQSKRKAGPMFFDVAFNYISGIDIEAVDQASRGIDPSSSMDSLQSATPVEQAAQIISEGAQKVQEAIVPPVPPASATPTKAGGAGGIWGFFGRGRQ